ncbi:hypothetical protein CesoFtcFv8_008322 [Champsocephalus esox]|uniref:Uncharacterized protein n=2 Tax=Champsocephalus TaxID=52236 RepID=A0AAN8DX86_CHAGU|nr:hypothetical protein CesoFtcFv8_008322 [Champsocephalus esox]KAK5925903.1 hypothetical protein CgunFtcFv8_021518 [Champsocephalus gunnari]
MKGEALPSLSDWQPANHKEGATLSDSRRERRGRALKKSTMSSGKNDAVTSEPIRKEYCLHSVIRHSMKPSLVYA